MAARRSAALALGVALLAGGCTVTRPGTLLPLPAGAAIPVTVTVTEDAATIRGVDPATGERLEGVLAAERPPRPPGGLAPIPPAAPPVGVAPAATGPVVIFFSGHLEGDHGTRLTCTLEVERRLRLRGSGLCRLAGEAKGPPEFRLTFR